jgi:hypothetical protein
VLYLTSEKWYICLPVGFSYSFVFKNPLSKTIMVSKNSIWFFKFHILTCSRALPDIGKILNSHQKIIKKSPQLRKIFKDQPLCSFRRDNWFFELKCIETGLSYFFYMFWYQKDDFVSDPLTLFLFHQHKLCAYIFFKQKKIISPTGLKLHKVYLELCVFYLFIMFRIIFSS